MIHASIHDPYSPELRRLFAAPAHVGDLEGAAVARRDEQDVRVQVAATAAGGHVEAMRFRAWGCPHLLAMAEAACAALEGMPVGALADWSGQELMVKLAVPGEKTGRILVLEDAVRALGQALCSEPGQIS